MRDVEIRRPGKVFRLHVRRTNFQLHALIFHLSDVHQVARKSRSHRNRAIHEQILCRTDIIFQRHVDTIPEAQIEAQIKVVVCFPLQIDVREPRPDDSRLL